jgi:YggT family protein
MGATTATLGLLADTVSSVQQFVDVFITVYAILIFAYILTSWVRLPYSPTLNRIQRFLVDVCEPYLRLFRRVLPPLGPLDLSPMVALFVLVLVGRLVNGLLDQLR